LWGKHGSGTEWRPFDHGIASSQCFLCSWYILINIIIFVLIVCISILPGSQVCHGRGDKTGFGLSFDAVGAREPRDYQRQTGTKNSSMTLEDGTLKDGI
jgi:hypothetical protein